MILTQLSPSAAVWSLWMSCYHGQGRKQVHLMWPLCPWLAGFLHWTAALGVHWCPMTWWVATWRTGTTQSLILAWFSTTVCRFHKAIFSPSSVSSWSCSFYWGSFKAQRWRCHMPSITGSILTSSTTSVIRWQPFLLLFGQMQHISMECSLLVSLLWVQFMGQNHSL